MSQEARVARTMTPTEWSMLLTMSVLWGGSFFFVGIAVKELPPLTIVSLRVALAAAMLCPMLRMFGLRFPNERRAWAAFLGMGLLNNVIPFCMIVWAQTQIPSGLAAILNAATPLFTVLVAHAFTPDEKLTGTRLAGVLVGLAGVVVIIGPNAFQGIGDGVLAELAVLAARLARPRDRRGDRLRPLADVAVGDARGRRVLVALLPRPRVRPHAVHREE